MCRSVPVLAVHARVAEVARLGPHSHLNFERQEHQAVRPERVGDVFDVDVAGTQQLLMARSVNSVQAWVSNRRAGAPEMYLFRAIPPQLCNNLEHSSAAYD